jgi:hypothetical protein
MELPGLAGNSLGHHPGVPVDQYAHDATLVNSSE